MSLPDPAGAGGAEGEVASRRGPRIAIVAGQLGLGGAERQLHHLATSLIRCGYRPLVVSFNGGAGDPWEAELRRVGVPVVALARGRRLARFWTTWRAARDHRADLIQGFHFYVNGYVALAARLAGCPSVGAIRFFPSRERLGETPGGPWRTWCVSGTDRLVCNSEAARREILSSHPGMRGVEVVPNGVAIPDDVEIARARKLFRESWGVSEGQPVVGFVGALNPNKNAALLLDALPPVVARLGGIRVFVLGDGPSRTALESQVEALRLGKVVTFLGATPGAQERMPAFDVICQTSNSEGAPNVLMEAAAAGIPAVATDVGGVSEVVLDGRTGRLVPPRDATAVGQALVDLLSDAPLRAAMGARAREWVSQSRSVDAMVDGYRRIYDSLLGASSRHRGVT